MASGDIDVANSSCLLSAAIDFGTTFSGWAFSFKHNFDQDPTNVTSKNWIGGSHISLKAPTCVLINPDGKKLEAFGYEAEDKYADLIDKKVHKEYYFFKQFKMVLFEKMAFHEDGEIDDDKGLSLPALRVFSLAIGYLKDDLLKSAAKGLVENALKEDEVSWVLTVPAIWTDSAKAFMRKAAKQAGIAPSSLTIALEPEAASLFCKHIPVEKVVPDTKGNVALSNFSPGSKYIVVDAGGGTVDVTVHEVRQDRKVKEIHNATGGAWGGSKVNDAFVKLLVTIVGDGIFELFKQEFMDDFIDLIRCFEVAKRNVNMTDDTDLKIHLPTSLKEKYEDETGQRFKERLAECPVSGISLDRDKLKIEHQVAKSFFASSVDSIVKHIISLLKIPAVKNANSLLLVGGFSESQMLQAAIRKQFPRQKVIIPNEASLTVLKGAVVFGHSRKEIVSRVSKYTYGIQTKEKFDTTKHPESRAISGLDGRKIVHCIFSKIVERGQVLIEDELCKPKPFFPTPDEKYMLLKLFASCEKDPQYIDDDGCVHIGDYNVDCRDEEGNIGGAKVSLGFGGTEIEVQVELLNTGKRSKVYFDCP